MIYWNKEKLDRISERINKMNERKMMFESTKPVEYSVLCEYVKDKKILGCLVAIKCGSGYNVGWSKFNYKKEIVPFNKKKAREIAMGRAINCSKIDQITFPNSFKKDLDNFIKRCKKYYRLDFYPNNYYWKNLFLNY